MDRDEHPQALTTTGPDATALDIIPAAIPSRDLPAFHRITDANQKRVKTLLDAIAIIEAEPVRMMGYARGAMLLSEQGMKGASESRLIKLYRAYVNSARNWEVLVDGALEHKPAVSIPLEFIAYLQEKVDENGRSVAMAIRLVRASWVDGASIPGYGTWREWFRLHHPGRATPTECPEHPLGWTLRNLRRHLDTSKARRIAQVRGLEAAKSHLPLIYTTRRWLWVGSHFMFDDMWHNLMVASKSEHKVGRPMELFAHDLFSARKVAWGFKVRTKNEDGKSSGLTSKMMRMLVAAWAATIGYSPRGTILVVEHGTAALSKALEDLLFQYSGGLITVSRSGMKGAAAHAGQYGGIGGGNPRHKASLESSNNWAQNLTGGLPGQTGKDRQHRPEGLAKQLQYNELILKAALELPPDSAALLQHDLLTDTQFALVLGQLYSIAERFDDHRLEGWEDNVVPEVHIMGAWRGPAEIHAMEPADRELVRQMMESGQVKTRVRQLSRREVWDRGCGELIKMSGGIICEILGHEHASERTVARHLFEFRDADLGPGLHRYESACITEDGARLALKEGVKYLTTANPFAPDELFVRDSKGRYLGTCKRLQSVDRGNPEAIKRAFGTQAKLQKEVLEPLVERQTKSAVKRLKLHQNNTRVVKDHLAKKQLRSSAALSSLAALAAADEAADATDSFDPATETNTATTHNENGYA